VKGKLGRGEGDGRDLRSKNKGRVKAVLGSSRLEQGGR